MSTKVNVLPSPTWNWLRVNEKILELKDKPCNEDITLAAGEQRDLVLDHDSSKEALSEHNLNITINENANLTLVEILRPGVSKVSKINASLSDNANLRVIQVFLSGREGYFDLTVDLLGKGSNVTVDSAYLLKGENTLGMNYVINHIGRDTHCDLLTRGVLYSGAEKSYKGTIDFKKGAKGAVGNEIEEVLLMDDDVINKSVPVILCAEEDVEGNHGASIGRLSEEMLFYMLSRGIEEQDIYKMMARARVESVARLIEDESLRDSLLDYMESNNGDN